MFSVTVSLFSVTWVLRLTLAVLVCALACAAYVAVRSYRAEAFWFGNHQHEVPFDGVAKELWAVQPVSFHGEAGVTLRGWYAPSRNRAAVVLTHGSGGDRRDVLAEAGVLSAGGFGVLLFDWPGHGESEGEVDWSASERAALVAAVDYLAKQPDVDPARLGGVGFSMGGFTMTQVAAVDQRLRAVALLGTPHDQEAHTRWEYRRYGALAALPALWAMERGGLRRDEMRPRDLIGKISPRAVVIVAGGEDHAVPIEFAHTLYALAGEPKELVVVPRAGHGDYLDADPVRYPNQLRGFFTRTLLGPP